MYPRHSVVGLEDGGLHNCIEYCQEQRRCIDQGGTFYCNEAELLFRCRCR